MPRRTPQRRRRKGERIVAQHCRIPRRPAPPHRVREQGSVTSDSQYPQNLPLQIDFARHFAIPWHAVVPDCGGGRRNGQAGAERFGTQDELVSVTGRWPVHLALRGMRGAKRDCRAAKFRDPVFLRAAERRCCSNPRRARVSRKTLVHAPLPCAVASQQGWHPFARVPKRRNRRPADPGYQTGNVSCRS